MGGGDASWDMIAEGVAKKLFVVHPCTLCQKLFMPHECRGVRGEQIDPIGKYREEKAISDAMA